MPVSLQGVYKLRGHDTDVDQGDVKWPRVIALDGDSVTVAGVPGFRGRTLCAATDHIDYASRRIARALPPDGSRPLTIKDYELFRLLPGRTVHLTFKMPLEGSVLPVVSNKFVRTVRGRKCVHLYWLSSKRLSFWTTNVTEESRCDPDDGSEKYAEDRFRENRARSTVVGSRVATTGGRQKRELPPAQAVAYSLYDKLEPTSPPPSDGPGNSDPVPWRVTMPWARSKAEPRT